MKKIVIAPDKFKGSLSSIEFCNIVEDELKNNLQEIEVVKLPLADGGDGTIQVIKSFTNGKFIKVRVQNPLGKEIESGYLYAEKQKLAFVELSEASGISLLKEKELNPLETTTFGTGELLKHAILRGARHIVLGIGGSATNDAGMGMAKALGFRFYNKQGKELQGKGADLLHLNFIDTSNALPQIKEIKFEVACDVDNPLFGENGAAHVYAAQKGADSKMISQLDKGLQNFNEVVKKQFEKTLQNIPGAGAAGGVGAACALFLNAKLKSGIELVKELTQFNTAIEGADWIITGEGKLDKQTLSGKVIKGILNSAENQDIAIFCGVNELSEQELKQHKISFTGETISFANGINDSIQNAANYLRKIVQEFVKQY